MGRPKNPATVAVGTRQGLLTVVRTGQDDARASVECMCECGNPVIFATQDEFSPKKSCGCMKAAGKARWAATQAKRNADRINEIHRAPEVTCLGCPAIFCSLSLHEIHYCTDRCRDRHKRKNGKGLSKRRGPYTCQNPACGNIYYTKPGRSTTDGSTFCDRKCSYAFKAGRKKKRCERLEVAAQQQRDARKYVADCSVCHKVFEAIHKKAICSDECRSVAARTYASERYLAKRGPVVSRICRDCGKPFIPEHHGRTVFCTQLCAGRGGRRAHPSNARKRARHHGCAYEPINKLTVFERCAWKCQHCRCDTPQNLMGTYEPNAPELDHILPVGGGRQGAHSYFNTQLLCASCNAYKSDDVEREPRLAGLADNQLTPFRVVVPSAYTFPAVAVPYSGFANSE
jgi:hypothetical protein